VGAQAFRALANRTFRAFFFAQCLSLIGSWTQQVAFGWLVFRLTNSVTWLGAVAFASQVPIFFIAPFGGKIADRFNRRRLLVLLQALAMLQAIALVLVAGSTYATPWNLFALALVLGCLSALEIPARQAFFPQLFGSSVELSNAIALNAMAVHIARFVGPLLAGWLIPFRNENVCFAFNAVTYVPLLVVLALLRMDSKAVGADGRGELRSGFAYAFKTPVIRAVLVSVAVVSLFGMPHAALLPAFVSETLHTDARMLGILVSASGAGAIIGGLLLASRLHTRGLERLLIVAPIVLGVSLILLACCHIVGTSVLGLAVIGFSSMIQMTAGNTLLQAMVGEEMRGRIMSFYVVAFMGMVPFGSLLMGKLADGIGVPATFALGGTVCVLVSGWFARQLRAPAHRTEAPLSKDELVRK
jgi:MFS family permease